MRLTVQEITDREQWDTFLMRQPTGHLLQSYDWGELIRYLGGHVYRLGALEHGQLVGALMLSVAPLPIPLPLPSGWRPHWFYGPRGPVVEYPHSAALPALLEHAHAIAQQEKAVVLRLEPNIDDDDPHWKTWLAAYQQLGFRTSQLSIHGRRSWVLDIRPEMSQLYANFRKAWRQNVRIAEQRGVKIREARTEEDFDTYYDLLTITSKRDGFFIHSKDYHREMLHRFAQRGDAVLYLAELDGMPVAAKMLIRFGDWCWDMFGATTSKKPDLPKGHLIQYYCIQWAKAKGCTYFDFRTIPEILEPGEEMWGVYHHKKGFGGFARLHIPTQDYVYRPFLYHLWSKLVAVRRAMRRKAHQHHGKQPKLVRKLVTTGTTS